MRHLARVFVLVLFVNTLPSDVPILSMSMPVEGPVTSRFGFRMSPFQAGKIERHSGIDLAVPTGTLVYASASGRVKRSGWLDDACGLGIVLEHHPDPDLKSLNSVYCHLQKILVERGAWISQNSVIGATGATGKTTGPHLHFGVFVDGVAVNPEPFLLTKNKNDNLLTSRDPASHTKSNPSEVDGFWDRVFRIFSNRESRDHVEGHQRPDPEASASEQVEEEESVRIRYSGNEVAIPVEPGMTIRFTTTDQGFDLRVEDKARKVANDKPKEYEEYELQTLQPTARPRRRMLPRRAQRYAPLIRAISDRFHVDATLVTSLIYVESAFDAKAVSRNGAKGLMQLLPSIARYYDVDDVFNPYENISGGVEYLSCLLQRFNGNRRLALAAYNAGEHAVEKYAGIPPYAETVNFVNSVIKVFGLLESGKAVTVDRAGCPSPGVAALARRSSR